MSDKCGAVDEAIRSASNSGAETMREAVKAHIQEVIEATRKACDAAWTEYTPELGLHAINVYEALLASIDAALPLPDLGAPASPWRDMKSAPKTGERILLKVRPRAQFGDETEQVAIGRWFDHNGTKMPWEGWKRGWSTDLAVYSRAFGWMPLPSTDLPTPPASKGT